MENKTSQRVLKKIKEKKIKPRARWPFVFKNFLIWGLSFFSLLFGAVFLSLAIYIFLNNDWDAYRYMGNTLPEFIISIFPYFHLFLFAIFFLAFFFNIRHTKRGYHYGLYSLVVGALFVSMVLGLYFDHTGINGELDANWCRHSSIYARYASKRLNIWNRPESGFLAGQMSAHSLDKRFVLHGMDGEPWVVDYRESFVSPLVNFDEDKHFRIIGFFNEGEDIISRGLMASQAEQANTFIAERILPSKSWGDLFFSHFDGRFIAQDKKMLGLRDCDSDSDCQFEFDDYALADCEYGAKCIDGSCYTVCQEYARVGFDNQEEKSCQRNDNCRCDFYGGTDIGACICFDYSCLAILRNR